MRSSSELQLHNQLLSVIGPSTEFFARCALQMYRISRGDLIHVLLCQGELLFASSLPVHSSFRVASDTTGADNCGSGKSGLALEQIATGQSFTTLIYRR